MTKFRKHFRDKYLSQNPSTKAWTDPDGDTVVFVAPSERWIRQYRDRLRDEDVDTLEVLAEMVIKVTHAPKTDSDGDPIEREGELVPADQIFDDGDVEMITKAPVGSPIKDLRMAAASWLSELDSLSQATMSDYQQFCASLVEASEDDDTRPDELLESAVADAKKLLGAEGND